MPLPAWRGLLAATALTLLAGAAAAQPREKPLREALYRCLPRVTAPI